MPIQFPQRDLTNQYISRSYQDVVQRFDNGSTNYLLDGLGYVIVSIPSSSLGNNVLTSDQTASYASFALSSLSASWAPGSPSTTASYAFVAISASFANKSIISDVASVADVALLADTASIAANADFAISSSFSKTASFALNAAGGSNLATGSLVPVTASWAQFASQAVSASWAPDIDNPLATGSLVPITSSQAITASWAQNSSTSSFALVAGNVGTNLSTGSQYYITASWALMASQSISASWAPYITNSLATGSLVPITASQSVSSSVSQVSTTASFALTAANAGTTLSTSSIYYITSSWAQNASQSISASWAPTVTSSLATGSLVPITSSYAQTSSQAISASWSPDQGATTLNTGSVYPITSSWSINSVTSSYISASKIDGTVPTASWAITSSFAQTASVSFFNFVNIQILNTTQSIFATQSITSTYATNSISSSYSDTLGGLSGSAYQQSLITASLIPITASWAINAINGGTTLNTGSTIPVTSSWAETASYTDPSSMIVSPNGTTSVITNNNAVTISVNNTPSVNVVQNTAPTQYIGSSSLLVGGQVSSSNINVGIPDNFNWGGSLAGSYLSNWNPQTLVSDILRFFAGAFSSSFPNPTPNTRTFGSITSNQNNAGSTVTINGRVPSGSTDANIGYLVTNGWTATGSQIFTTFTFRNSSTFNTTYTSVIGGSTTISSSIGAQAFGLGPLNGSNLQTFYVSSSITERFYSSSAFVPVFSYVSQSLYSQSLSTNNANGLNLQSIPSANPAVIPAVYQDGNFAGITGSGLVWNNTGNNLTLISSSGRYDISASIGIASGSSPYQYLIATSVAYFYTPIADGNFSTNTLAAVGVATASISANSRSLSGAPYLTTGSTWQYTFTGSGAFSPLYNNGTIAQLITGSNPTAVTTPNTITASINTTNGTVAGGGAIIDSITLSSRAVGTVPNQSDYVAFNTFLTASGTGSNIIQIGTSTVGIPASSSLLNRAGASSLLGLQTIFYHNAGTFGKPLASGSLAYFGRPQGYVLSTETGTSETFVDEAQRIILSDACLSFTGSYFTSSVNLNPTDLQVKPGYLVNPGGTYRYWYPNAFGNTAKFYIRHFRRSGVVGSLVIDPGVSIANWDDVSNPSISIALLFESAKSGVFGNTRLYDINKLVGSILTNVTTGYTNPFSQNVDIYYNGTGTKAGTQITVPIVNANGMFLDGTSTRDEFYLIVRYNGDPVPLININVTP